MKTGLPANEFVVNNFKQGLSLLLQILLQPSFHLRIVTAKTNSVIEQNSGTPTKQITINKQLSVICKEPIS